MRYSQLRVVALMATPISAHLSIWHPSIFGFLPDEVNTDNMSQPLQDYTFDQWWWHGVLDQPPEDGEIFELPANGKIETVIASNKGNTPFGHGFLDEDPTKAPEPWLNENGWGNMHAPERSDVAGSALAIAYKSDQYEVEPSDFVVFSVVHDSPARQLQSWDIPDLPACPDDKCMCSWFWIHKSIGGTDQMYMTPFVCKVAGATNVGKVAAGRTPVDFRDDQGKCVRGPKSPMYWKNLEGNNMPNKGGDAPIYSDGYGIGDGAQNDIFE